jgi:hypothetical protein
MLPEGLSRWQHQLDPTSFSEIQMDIALFFDPRKMAAHAVKVAKLQIVTDFRLCRRIAILPLARDNKFINPGLFVCEVLHDNLAATLILFKKTVLFYTV